jgi:hypothetical protein
LRQVVGRAVSLATSAASGIARARLRARGRLRRRPSASADADYAARNPENGAERSADEEDEAAVAEAAVGSVDRSRVIVDL